ncbi:MAG: TonB-dependent receptor [Parvularculaceae bacterium]|nr:TonB-dependent receptor [Parvularculaceae bacterium]
MKIGMRTLLLASGATLALTVNPVAAQGQTGNQTDNPDTLRDDEDVVIVTARKTEETLLEVPLAVSVVSGEFLDDTGFTQIQEVMRFVPGFDLTPTNTTRASGAKIRGISTFSFSDGFESSVATVIDGVVLGREAQGFFDFLDVEAIEVIKGPQGTLFGKNASAGVVNIRTRQPEFEFGGQADISYGSFNEVIARAAVTGPLSDTVAFRLSATRNRRDGLLDNAIPGEDDINDKDTYGLRGKLLFQPSDAFSVTLAADYVEEENRCCMPTFRVAGGPTGAVPFALNPGVIQLEDALAEFDIVAGPGNRRIGIFDDNILQESEAGGISATVDYDFGNHALRSITAWRDWNIDEFNEADGVSNSNVNNRNGTVSSAEQFSQEFQLSGSLGEGKIDYVSGLFYFHQEVDAQGQVDIDIALPFPPFFNARTNADRTVTTDSAAIFGEFTYNVTDRLSLVAGGRYTREELDATYERVATPINPAFPIGPFFGPDVAGEQQVTDYNLSGRFIGRYFWTENLMTYLSWSRGYKGPGIDVAESVNVNAIEEPGGLPVLKPEIPILWEAGLKATMLDGDAALNVAVYDQTVNDLQTINTDNTGTVTNLSIDEISSQGVEADLTVTPSGIPGLTVVASLTFNDVEIVQFDERPDLEGIRFRDNPKWFYSAFADYRRSLSDQGHEGFVRAEWTWQSSKNAAFDRADFTEIDAYGLLNLRAGFDAPDRRWGIVASVENVLDEDYPFFVFGSSYRALDGTTSNHYLGEPRIYNVQLRTRF